MGIALRYEDSVEQLDAVKPLWDALQAHHARITPELSPQTPKRDLAEAWRVRRSKYVRWPPAIASPSWRHSPYCQGAVAAASARR